MSESLKSAEQEITGLWDHHLASEFAHKDTELALTTMVPNAHVAIVPTMVGGRGTEELRTFYSKHFLNQIPPDLEMRTVSRTTGQGRVVDEVVAKFTHSMQMDWLLPAVPPTGKRIELAFVVVVYTEGDRIAAEHLYWDNASVMRQAGLLPEPRLPVLGPEAARFVDTSTGQL
ncbi:MAG: ester cyclase, partial [Kofleriaceae bacterium]